MKKAIYSVVLLSVLSLPALALAEDGVEASASVRADASVRTNFTEHIKNIKDEVRERVDFRKASSTERREEKVGKLSQRMVKNAGKVMQATLERLQKIATRIESRITKVKSAGGDTTLSEKFLAEGKVHLTEAQTSLTAFLAIDVSSNVLSENIAKLREAAKAVKTHLREAHTSLVQAIVNLKGNSTSVHATTTAGTTSQ